jgi:hypothetical protein
MKTAIEKLEALFYNEADPTINSNSWVIHERTLKRLFLAAKVVEKEQIKIAFEFGTGDAYNFIEDDAEQYYNQTYKTETNNL